jgi:hypothetical protein
VLSVQSRLPQAIVAYSEVRYDTTAPLYKVALAVVHGEKLEMVSKLLVGLSSVTSTTCRVD